MAAAESRHHSSTGEGEAPYARSIGGMLDWGGRSGTL